MIYRDHICKVYEDKLSQASAPLSETDPQWRYLMKFLPADPAIRILDAGCGSGRYARKLAELGRTNIVAVDLFEHLPAKGFLYRQADISRLDFTEEEFDFIYSHSVIYYLPQPQTALAEFFRVLKPQGLVLFSAHTRYSFFTLERIVQRFWRRAEHLQGVRFYSAGHYVAMLRRIGFEVLDVDGFDLCYSPGNLFKIISRCLARCFRKKPVESDATISPFPDSRKWLKRLRSLCGYHLLIAARKPKTT